MSRLSGTLLIVAGAGLAAYVLQWSVDLAETAKKVASPSSAAQPSKPRRRKYPPLKVRPFQRRRQPVSSDTAAVPATSPWWTPRRANRKNDCHTTSDSRSQSAPGAPAASAASPLDRARLTKELLVELKRVGCYQGPVGTVWTPVARRSMKAFTEHVNATLPVEQPDYILLVMVQSHAGQACGRDCSVGEARIQDGRCLPMAVIAAKETHDRRSRSGCEDGTRAARATTRRWFTPGSDRQRPFRAGAFAMGRMSLAGPKQELPSRRQAGEAVSDVPPAPVSGGPDKSGSRQVKVPGQQRHTSKSSEPRRARNSASRPPSWVPWSRPWAMN